jgi:hypothetical protein
MIEVYMIISICIMNYLLEASKRAGDRARLQRRDKVFKLHVYVLALNKKIIF